MDDQGRPKVVNHHGVYRDSDIGRVLAVGGSTTAAEHGRTLQHLPEFFGSEEILHVGRVTSTDVTVQVVAHMRTCASPQQSLHLATIIRKEAVALRRILEGLLIAYLGSRVDASNMIRMADGQDVHRRVVRRSNNLAIKIREDVVVSLCDREISRATEEQRVAGVHGPLPVSNLCTLLKSMNGLCFIHRTY